MEATHLVFGFGIGICIGFVICVVGLSITRKPAVRDDQIRRKRSFPDIRATSNETDKEMDKLEEAIQHWNP